MRKLFWCSAVLMLASAAWLYMAAAYVSQYPDSLLGQCAVLAYRVGTEYNPMFRISQNLCERCRLGMDRMWNHHDCTTAVDDMPRLVAAPIVPSVEEIAACDPYNVIELKPCDSVPCEDHPEVASNSSVDQVASASLTVEVEPDAADTAPKTMPPVGDDDKDEEPPATMPYEDDEDADQALFSFWKSLFIDKPAEAANDTQAPSSSSSTEESESVTPTEPREYPMDPPSSSSTCPSCPERSVTCPYTGRTYPANPSDDSAPAPKMKKKKKAAKMSKLSKLLEKEKGTEDVPVHTEVDTTEFRRGDDARKGEFKPMPE